MSDGFEFPKDDWKPLKIAPLCFGARLTNGVNLGGELILDIDNEKPIYELIDRAYFYEQITAKLSERFEFKFLSRYLKETINFSHIIKEELDEYIAEIFVINLSEKTGICYFSFEPNDNFPLEIEREVFSIFLDKNKNNLLGTKEQPLNFIPDNSTIAFYPLISYYFTQYAHFFYNAVYNNLCTVHARVGSILTRKYEIIPPSIFSQLTIESWYQGIASFENSEKIYDIHISLNQTEKPLKEKLQSTTFEEILSFLKEINLSQKIENISVKELCYQIEEKRKANNSKIISQNSLYEYVRKSKDIILKKEY